MNLSSRSHIVQSVVQSWVGGTKTQNPDLGTSAAAEPGSSVGRIFGAPDVLALLFARAPPGKIMGCLPKAVNHPQ